MATLKDIANLAGVSQGTVSNVLNGRGNVSSQKIKLVEAAASQLGYTVNERAKLLRKGFSNILALVIPDTRTRNYNDIYTSFKICAEKHGYMVSLYLTDGIPTRELNLIGKLRSDMVAGVAIITCLEKPAPHYLDAGFSESQLLFLERGCSDTHNFVGFDYRKAGIALGEIAASCNGNYALFTEIPCFSNDSAFFEGFSSASIHANSFCSQAKISRQQAPKDIIQFLSFESDITCFFTSSFSLAEALSSVIDTFFPKYSDVPVYTVSPLYTLPEKKYHKYEFDYRLCGKSAADQLILQLTCPAKDTSVQILSNAGFRKWLPSALAAPVPKELNLLILNGPEATAIRNLSRIYTEHTGIDIRISVYSYDEIFEILSNTGGKAYDILRIDITFLSWFAQKLLIPLQELDPNIEELLPQFVDGVSQRYSTVAGKIYALPFSPSVQLLYYRRDLFESTVLKRLYQEQYKCELLPPADFTEYNRIARFFTRQYNANSPVHYGSSLTLGSIGVASSEFLARFFESHKHLYDEDGHVRLNSISGRTALHQLIELKNYAPPTQSTAWWTDTAEAFASGDLAMAILYSNYASDLLKDGSSVQERIGCTLVPGRNPILGGASLGIAKSSHKQAEALNFIKWLCSETVSSASVLLGGVSPCKSAYENCQLADTFPWLDLAGKSFSIANNRRQPPDYPFPFNERQFLNIIGMAVKNAYNGVQSPEHALDWAQQEFDRSFSFPHQ